MGTCCFNISKGYRIIHSWINTTLIRRSFPNVCWNVQNIYIRLKKEARFWCRKNVKKPFDENVWEYVIFWQRLFLLPHTGYIQSNGYYHFLWHSSDSFQNILLSRINYFRSIEYTWEYTYINWLWMNSFFKSTWDFG